MSEIPEKQVMAEALVEIQPGVFRWAAYSARHRVELTSHGMLGHGVLTVFDPIRLRPDLLDALLEKATCLRVFLTSENHWRAADIWKQAGATVTARCAAGFTGGQVEVIGDDSPAWNGYLVVPLNGGAAGECALVDAERRIAVCGDALVNLPERGLEVLPEKYCRDQAGLIAAITGFAQRKIEWIFPAHGQPIGPDADVRLEKLIAEKKKDGAHDRT